MEGLREAGDGAGLELLLPAPRTGFAAARQVHGEASRRLDVSDMHNREVLHGVARIIGTTRMGDDPRHSVVA